MKSQAQTNDEYVLGTNDAEIARLAFQHQAWLGCAADAWERAGIQRGDTVIDAGCGPGNATFDFSRLVGSSGRVFSFDLSSRFIEFLRRQIVAREIKNVEARQHDLMAGPLPMVKADAAFIRWVLCFVSDPVRFLMNLAPALKRGGRVVIQDYYQYESVCISPPHVAFDKFFAATARSWRKRGGDPEVGKVLPRALARAGFKLIEIKPLVRLARPGDPLWHWPDTFFSIYAKVLVELKLLSRADAGAFARVWKQRSGDPHAIFTTPPMLEIIAEKK